ncbi:MAG: RNA polymerase sigma-70 factor [Flavobacteriales bacterium]|nr:RNA polymerase sigma-70 factor [Flavobacteriales bacterium]
MAESSGPLDLEGLFRLHYRALCGAAFGYLKDAAQAEDLVQELFAKLWQERDTLEFKVSPKAYLFAAVRNRCLNALAAGKRMRPLNEELDRLPEEDVKGEEEHAERSARVLAAIEGLPPERRRIFRMSRNEGLKYQQIAERLGLSVKTVENQMGHALKTLRQELADLLPLALLGWGLWEIVRGGWG